MKYFKGRNYFFSNLVNILSSLVIIFSFFNDEHRMSISLILVTFWVLKLDKSIFVNDEHSLNIPLISLTLLVLKLDKFIFVKDEHSYHSY